MRNVSDNHSPIYKRYNDYKNGQENVLCGCRYKQNLEKYKEWDEEYCTDLYLYTWRFTEEIYTGITKG